MRAFPVKVLQGTWKLVNKQDCSSVFIIALDAAILQEKWRDSD